MDYERCIIGRKALLGKPAVAPDIRRANLQSSRIMSEPPDEKYFEPEKPVGSDTEPESSQGLSIQKPNNVYLKIVNKVRIAVAIAAAFCGMAFVICYNRYDYLTETPRRESGLWGWGAWTFGIGFAACLIAALTLIIEYLARPSAPKTIMRTH